MKDIGQFFGRFKNKALEQVQMHSVVSEVINKILKIKIDIKDISIRDGIVQVKASQTLKNEIYVKKNLILTQLTKKLPGTRINDIK